MTQAASLRDKYPTEDPNLRRLLVRQFLFAEALSQLIHYAAEIGLFITFGEGYLGDSVDKPHEDTPHLRDGLHFKRLAQDLNLFNQRGDNAFVWLKSGDEPEWWLVGRFWEGLHPLCRWGGRFAKRDSNHFSVEWEGKA